MPIINGMMSLRVKDVMSSPVITVKEATSVDRAAQLMGKHNIGCIIVTNEEGMPLGIITERDLALRVVAENLKPHKVASREVMSSPLFTTTLINLLPWLRRELVISMSEGLLSSKRGNLSV